MADTENTNLAKQVVADSEPNHAVEGWVSMYGMYKENESGTDAAPVDSNPATKFDPSPFTIKGT